MKNKPNQGRQNQKLVSVTMYLDDLDDLDATIESLKKKGYYKASRSWTIRQALKYFDPNKLPPPKDSR